MKKLFTLSLLFSFTSLFVVAQDKTTVTAKNAEISDNLDLRAVATIFGESSDLEDFEKRINDPKAQISNLDLNNDDYVDYLRVIESIEGNDHIIIVQSVIDTDIYQDVASIEIQKDNNNNIQVQVVGDVYMYGENYIYEPVYAHRPIIYSTFWSTNYSPYYSSWNWNYYPSYYSFWNPFPIFRYRNHINIYIGNYGHHYNYVNYRNCSNSYNSYYRRRANAYESRYPERSFSHRNATVSNRYELDRTRNTRSVNVRKREITQPRMESSSRTSRDARSRNTKMASTKSASTTLRPIKNSSEVRNERSRNTRPNSTRTSAEPRTTKTKNTSTANRKSNSSRNTSSRVSLSSRSTVGKR
ncbi:hypothetical protein [uncultured Flavobacterium sp.]|uniref:hypothetical protein n=1 Tax=uncultured Flavobacterium sp. TaxID=165435 RepID=UPI0030CA52B1|tara:strand:+ start:449 stop:1516 length:1068 start_codon:yes stop_codon:yes gene_type:complete